MLTALLLSSAWAASGAQDAPSTFPPAAEPAEQASAAPSAEDAPVQTEDEPGAPAAGKGATGRNAARQVDRARGGGRNQRQQETAGQAASNDLWYAAAAVGGLVLVGVGLFWFRGPRRASPLPDGVRAVPQQGLFGAGTPALTPGVSQWVAAEADQADLVRHLCERVAAQRPVLVQAPDTVDLGEVARGPAFRAAFTKAPELQDAAYDLQEDHPALALLLHGVPGNLAEWAGELEKDFPVLVVLSSPVPGAGRVVRCARAGGEWTFEAAPA